MMQHLGSWLMAHRDAAADTYLYLARHSFSTVIAWIIMGVSLALPAGLHLIYRSLEGAQVNWTTQPAMSVFFSPDLAPSVSESLSQRIGAMPGVASTRYVSADAAWAEFRAELQLGGNSSEVMANPLPASVLVAVDQDIDLAGLRARLSELEGVDQIVAEDEWIARLRALMELTQRVFWVLGGLLAISAAAVVASAVRLAIDDRVEEVRVMGLVGATQAQIRRPFLYLGLWYGVGAGVLGALVLALALGAIAEPLGSLSASYRAEVAVDGFNIQLVGTLLGVGILLGVAGAWLSAVVNTRAVSIH